MLGARQVGVLECRDGTVTAIDVTASATPRGDDVRGLRFLRDKPGDRIAMGVVLNTGAATVRFEDRLAAAPVCALSA